MSLGALKPDPKGEFPLSPAPYLTHLLFQLVIRRQELLDIEFHAIGLNVSKWRALFGCWRLTTCTMGELARITGIDRTTLTRTVDRLIEDGHVNRSASPTDRRQVILSMTPSGVAAYEKALAIQTRMAETMVRDIPDEMQREACRTIIRFLANALGDEDQARAIADLRLTDTAPSTNGA